MIFVAYVVHKVSNILSAALNASGHAKASQLFNKTCLNNVPLANEHRGGPQCFTGAYFLHLLFRTLLEVGFGAAHYYLFGFYVPTRFLCQQAPCTTQVDCYVSRPTEKTVMLNFMLAVATLSLFLNVVDLMCTIKQSVRQKTCRKMMVEKIFEEEQRFLSSEVASAGTDANTAPAQQDGGEQPVKTGSFRKRRGSRGSCGGLKLCSDQEAPSHLCSLSTSCNKNDDYSQEDVLERNGSEVALCPSEQIGTPRSIRINKRSRLKPPPPPRRETGLSSVESGPQVGSFSTATAVCSRRVGQCTLVELSTAPEPRNDNGQEKRSEWV